MARTKITARKSTLPIDMHRRQHWLREAFPNSPPRANPWEEGVSMAYPFVSTPCRNRPTARVLNQGEVITVDMGGRIFCCTCLEDRRAIYYPHILRNGWWGEGDIPDCHFPRRYQPEEEEESEPEEEVPIPEVEPARANPDEGVWIIDPISESEDEEWQQREEAPVAIEVFMAEEEPVPEEQVPIQIEDSEDESSEEEEDPEEEENSEPEDGVVINPSRPLSPRGHGYVYSDSESS